MRDTFLILALVFIFYKSSYSQSRDLILLASHPFYDAPPFPSYLFRLNETKGSLDTLFQLSTGKETIREVKYYPDQRKMIVVKDGGFLTNNTHKVVQFIDMDSPAALDSLQLDSLNNKYLHSWLFNLGDQKTLFGVQLSNPGRNQEDLLLGININDFSLKKLTPEIFVKTEITGNAGACLLSSDALGVYTNPNSGELRIPKALNITERPIFPISLPMEFHLPTKERRSIVINNNTTFAFSLANSKPTGEALGYTDLVILDKTSDSWFKQRVKGNTDFALRSFPSWVVGTVYSDNKRFDDKDRIIDKLNRVSPGKESRRQKPFKTGMPADFRFEYFGVYSPGILYLLNVQTRTYFEWKTRQGDSEILLVENNEVYYRVNDEIYKASIVKGKKLGKSKLLIRDEIVPDIHWAFISKQ